MLLCPLYLEVATDLTLGNDASHLVVRWSVENVELVADCKLLHSVEDWAAVGIALQLAVLPLTPVVASVAETHDCKHFVRHHLVQVASSLAVLQYATVRDWERVLVGMEPGCRYSVHPLSD